jgi:hypothetical protein
MSVPVKDPSRLYDGEIDEFADSTPWSLGIVLDQINDIRAAMLIGEGKLDALPQAAPGSPEMCVLARALSNGWVASVTDRISLLHDPGIESGLLGKMADGLRAAGFTVIDATSEVYAYQDGTFSYIDIDLTEEMNSLISDFDEYLLPDLILPGYGEEAA